MVHSFARSLVRSSTETVISVCFSLLYPLLFALHSLPPVLLPVCSAGQQQNRANSAVVVVVVVGATV